MNKWVYRYKTRSCIQCGDKVLSHLLSTIDWNRIAMVFIFISFSSIGSAQEYTKTFVKEVTTIEQPTVSSNVPSSLSIQIDGASAHRNNTKFGYIIKGSNNQDLLYINKDYTIETWDKNIIRQEVDVTIRSDDRRTAEALLDQLAIKLPNSPEGQIIVDANMNFKKFEMKNRRFKEDYGIVTLDEGNSYELTYLEIKTRLFIPRKSNLKVASILHHTLRLGDIEGDLDLDLQYGEVFGKKINNLNANLRFCFNVIFEEANSVIASATNSHLKIAKVNKVELGKIRLGKGPLVHGDQIQWLDNNSSMNIYNFRNVNRMIVHDSANDDFKIGEVDDLEVASSIYSDYQISKVNNELIFNGKNGDLSIAEVARAFEHIDIHSKLSKLNINVAEDENYTIKVFDPARLESKLPSTARQVEGDDGSHLLYKMGTGISTAQINIRCDRCDLDIWE